MFDILTVLLGITKDKLSRPIQVGAAETLVGIFALGGIEELLGRQYSVDRPARPIRQEQAPRAPPQVPAFAGSRSATRDSESTRLTLARGLARPVACFARHDAWGSMTLLSAPVGGGDTAAAGLLLAAAGSAFVGFAREGMRETASL
jgi:hypothetical protein